MLKGNYKIDVSQLNTVERTKLQEELFKMGYKWFDGKKEIEALDQDFLFIYDDMDITCCDEQAYFDKTQYPIITVPDIMALKPDSTLRDQFAGQALAALITNPETCGTYENMSNIAYAYADAMLKERNNHV